MQALAPIGSIAATEQIRRLCEGYFVFKSLGPTKVKGVSEPVNVCEVTGLGPLRTRLQRAATRGYTKFVGRDREMEALRRAAEQAKPGHGQVVAVMAEPGVGKSRLIYEFKATNQSGWMVLETLSFSHGKATAYQPVLDLLQAYFRIAPEDDHRARREKVAGRIMKLDRTLEDTLPYLFGLLGFMEGDHSLAAMDPQIKRRRTHDALKRILLRESLDQPLMVIFEDLHWIDEETQAFLNLLADSIGTAKLLLLVSYRPEYSHQWSGKTYYTQLRLDPLGRESANEMLDALLGVSGETTDEPLAALKRLIIEKTEGTPLFMEEIVQALQEDGTLVRNGVVTLTRPVGALKIPPTVQAILASRIDRLPVSEKELLQTLAVIGMEYAIPLVREVVKKPDDELNRMLNDLQLAELIYEQPAAGDLEYTFKHALTREVAQTSLLLERRRQIHERVGATIERLYESNIEEHLSELADHYRHTHPAEKAVHFLRRAAEQAVSRSAFSEGEAQLRDALALLATLPVSANRDRTELGLQTTLGWLLSQKSIGSPEREELTQRAYELCRRMTESSEVLPAFFEVVQFYLQRNRLGEALEFAGQALELAERSGDPLLMAGACYNAAESSFWSGNLTKCQAHLERAFAMFQAISTTKVIQAYGFDWWIGAAEIGSLTELLLGRLGRSIFWQVRLSERIAFSSHPYEKSQGTTSTMLIEQVRGACGEVRKHVVEAQRLCKEFGLHEMTGWVKALGGWAAFWNGEMATGLVEMKEAASDLAALGSFVISTWRLVLVAKVQIELEDCDAATATVAETFENLTRTGEGWCEAEVFRIAGELERRKAGGDLRVAEKQYRRAIEIGRNQGAKWWELRASKSLARLLRDTNRGDEARLMLSDIYHWFAEGFDTADLKDARALLDELSTSSMG
jgi:tetratricopeptide (TPR) repeat protein